MERPILFSGPMVRAILDGRKTQTRRVLKPQPVPVGGPFYRPSPMVAPREWHSVSKEGNIVNIQKLPYAEGTELWVREAWRTGIEVEHVKPSEIGYTRPVRYEADDSVQPDVDGCAKIPTSRFGKLRPGMFMPRWASRITLRVTAVKVERLQDISDEDAKAEGIFQTNAGSWSAVEGYAPLAGQSPKGGFYCLWTSINGPGSWDANPWVVAYSFERVLPK